MGIGMGFDFSAFLRNIGKKESTQLFASTNHAAKSINKQIGKQVASNAGVDGGLLGFAKSVDSALGGYGQSALDTVQRMSKEPGILQGLMPGSEVKTQVKRTLSDTQKDELGGALRKQATNYDTEMKRLTAYKEAIGKATGDDWYNAAEVVKTRQGSVNLHGKEETFDFSSYGTDKKAVDEALSRRITTLEKQTAYTGSELENVEKNFFMQDQNALEKTMSYFSDAQYGNKRAIAAGVGVAALGVGGRLASGGSLTRNANGESDIALVPFI